MVPTTKTVVNRPTTVPDYRTPRQNRTTIVGYQLCRATMVVYRDFLGAYENCILFAFCKIHGELRKSFFSKMKTNCKSASLNNFLMIFFSTRLSNKKFRKTRRNLENETKILENTHRASSIIWPIHEKDTKWFRETPSER